MGVIADTLAPKIAIYNKNKDVWKKMSSKAWKLTDLWTYKKKSETFENVVFA